MNEQTEKPRVPDTTEPCPPENLPVTYLPDATEEEAARQGHWAYGYANDATDNPYAHGTRAHAAWAEAWNQSRVDDAG